MNQKSAWVCLFFLCSASIVSANDWPYWRGPEQNGFSREKAPVTKWSLQGENLLWKSDQGGRTTPIVMNGRVYLIAPIGDDTCVQEHVVCLDAETGKQLWNYVFNVFHSDIAENRVGWTALCGDPETGNVYAHGTGGEFFCFDRDGKVLWKHSLTEEYNRVSGYGGRLHTPMIDEDRVIVSFLSTNWGNHAKPMHRYLALDKRTGSVVWWAEPGDRPEDTTYACPIVAVIGGRRMLLAPNGDANVYGMLARTGQRQWVFKLSKRGLNSSMVADGDHVFALHSEENVDSTVMGRTVCIDATKTGDITQGGEVWRLDGLDAGYASPALGNGRLYIIDNSANLYTVDARTGKEYWKYSLGRVGKGSPIVTADGVIYVCEQNGFFHILRDAGDKCESLDVKEFAKLPDDSMDEMFGSPALANGRVYFMARSGTYCLGTAGTKGEPVAIPPMPPEKNLRGGKPASLLVVPGEVALKPGESVKFEVRAFLADGGPPTIADAVTWTLAGPKGSISADGTFTAAGDAKFTAGLLTAKVGDLTAAARIRIAPPLPVKEDFESVAVDQIPPGWVGVMGKCKVVARDGSKVLCKLAEKGKASPFWRIRGFSHPPLPAGGMVQADMLGTLARKRFKPDMGVINCRYELIVLGQTKELELARWRDEPNHSLRKRVPFEMNVDTWYRTRLSVQMQGDKALVRGKVWPRDGAEPQTWNIEFEDPCPNREGSPGLYAYSNGTSEKSDGTMVFFDNYQVTADP